MNKRVEAKTDYLGTSPFLGLTEEEAEDCILKGFLS